MARESQQEKDNDKSIVVGNAKLAYSHHLGGWVRPGLTVGECKLAGVKNLDDKERISVIQQSLIKTETDARDFAAKINKACKRYTLHNPGNAGTPMPL